MEQEVRVERTDAGSGNTTSTGVGFSTNIVNALPGGRVPAPLERRHAPCGPKGPSLHIVGDYLFDSTLNGVLESAHHVARASW